MELYAMTEFFTVELLFFSLTDLTDYQYLYIDLFTVIPLITMMGYTHPVDELSPHLP